jgi:hypothetical protein
MPKFRQMPKLRRMVSEVTCSHCRSSRLARCLRLQRAMQTKPSFVIDVIRTAANAVSSAATRTA